MDITLHLDAVDRGLEVVERDGDEVVVQTLEQTYRRPIADVWDALTSPERLPRWFLPVTGDLRLGGRYQLVGNAGGTVEACEPPTSFRVTWEFGGGVTWLTVRLHEERSGAVTRLELEHVARVADLPPGMWEQTGPSATGIGWDQALLGLALHFTTGEVSPENAEAWVASDEGLAFMRGSADRWAAAHIASGTDPDVARAAADTTFAMYTGQLPGPMD